MVQNDNFPVKKGLFICKFKIRGPNWQNVSTANNEGNLYLEAKALPYIFIRNNSGVSWASRFVERKSSFPTWRGDLLEVNDEDDQG